MEAIRDVGCSIVVVVITALTYSYVFLPRIPKIGMRGIFLLVIRNIQPQNNIPLPMPHAILPLTERDDA